MRDSPPELARSRPGMVEVPDDRIDRQMGNQPISAPKLTGSDPVFADPRGDCERLWMLRVRSPCSDLVDIFGGKKSAEFG